MATWQPNDLQQATVMTTALLPWDNGTWAPVKQTYNSQQAVGSGGRPLTGSQQNNSNKILCCKNPILFIVNKFWWWLFTGIGKDQAVWTSRLSQHLGQERQIRSGIKGQPGLHDTVFKKKKGIRKTALDTPCLST